MTQLSKIATNIEPKHVGFWLRLFATIIDLFVILAIAFVHFLILILIQGMENLGITNFNTKVLAQFFTIFVGTILIVLYFPVFESSYLQATLGKHILRLKVSNLSSEKITLDRAINRNLWKIVSMHLCMIGFFMIIWTDRKQGLHDYLTQTVVIFDN